LIRDPGTATGIDLGWPEVNAGGCSRISYQRWIVLTMPLKK